MNNLKKLLLFFVLIFLASNLFAQQQPWWFLMEQGRNFYRSGQYGHALMAFEDARRARRAMYEQMERDLVNLLSINAVRRMGDSLEHIEQFARERRHDAATAAFAELFHRVPRASLNNSAAAALEAVIRLQEFPEAEYWIGEIYRVEGEFSLALMQFRRALELRDLMENPAFALEIQYKTAEILRVRQEYNEMIRTYLAIIDEHDHLWTDRIRGDAAALQVAAQVAANVRHTPIPYALASASLAVSAMNRTLEIDGINRFMELYRYNNPRVERAHRRLGFFYAVTGRPTAQQHLMFAFLIQNTVIIEEVMRRQFDFVFSDLETLALEIFRNPLLVSYVEETEYFRTAFYLANSLFRNGRTLAARNLWTFLSTQPKAGEWHHRAISQLQNPRLDPVVEMP